MKSFLLALCAFAATASLARAESYPFKEAFSRTEAFNATGELSLENINGGVEVSTWDKNEILIEVEKSAKTDEELKQIDLTIETSPAAVNIKTHLPKRSGSWFSGNSIRAAVSFRLTVPSRAVIRQLSSVNGSVTLNGSAGPVKATTVNGRITATGLRGDAKLTTVNGSVHAAFASLGAEQHLTFDSVNGSITVALPADAGVAVRASVVNGHIDCDFPLTFSSGRVNGGRLNGTIGDGRATLKAESVNGSIHFQSAKLTKL